MLAAEVQNISKRFRIPHQRRTTILEQVHGLLSLVGGKSLSYEDLWAIRNVSFSVQQGKSLGIVGPNGSGKSTLLKLLAGVLRPDAGTIRVSGRVAQILELGIGFHSDLTVLENATVYGVLMGISRKEIKRRMNAILEFAGLAKFQDARLSHLSSGMVVRLGFAIAVETDADIFLVDEALAVGDSEFRARCIERFSSFRKAGKTIILASHETSLLRSFCENTLYLFRGEEKALGPTDEVLEKYSMYETAGSRRPIL